MADVSIKLTLSEAVEVKQVLAEVKEMREKVLTSANMRDEYARREEGPAELRRLEERYGLLESALRKMG